jgi:hypothetical protein
LWKSGPVESIPNKIAGAQLLTDWEYLFMRWVRSLRKVTRQYNPQWLSDPPEITATEK